MTRARKSYTLRNEMPKQCERTWSHYNSGGVFPLQSSTYNSLSHAISSVSYLGMVLDIFPHRNWLGLLPVWIALVRVGVCKHREETASLQLRQLLWHHHGRMTASLVLIGWNTRLEYLKLSMTLTTRMRHPASISTVGS